MFQSYKVAYARKHIKVRDARKFSFLRQSVAFMLSESARQIPHASMVSPIDVTPLVEFGRKSGSEIRKGAEGGSGKALFRRAIRKNFSAFFVKAIAHALQKSPCVNAFLDYAPLRYGGTLYHAEDINIAVTVKTKWGVITPIVRNAHLKDLETVASELRTQARKARRTDPEELYLRCAKVLLGNALRQLDITGWRALYIVLRSLLWDRPRFDPALRDVAEEDKLHPDDILAATCTLANIGMMVPGNQTVTVIVQPQVVFFGIGDLHLAPAVVDGEIVSRYMMTLNATMDHRAFDAGEAFPFLQFFRDNVNQPKRIYEWKQGDEL